MFKIGDEVYVDTTIPNGWPTMGAMAVFNTGIREATIIDLGLGQTGFLVEGVVCKPMFTERLITGRIVRQLEND